MARCLSLLATLVAVFVAASPLHAQSNVSVGLNFGYNIATLRSDGADTGYRTAATGGLFLEVTALPGLTLRPEVLLGGEGTTIQGNETGEIAFKVTYVQVPLLLKGDLPFLRRFRPHVVVGPAVALKVLERQGVTGSGFNINLGTDRGFYTHTDVRLIAGLGAGLGAGPGRAQVQLRYTHGLTDVARNVSDQPFGESLFPASGEHGVFTIMLSFGM